MRTVKGYALSAGYHFFRWTGVPIFIEDHTGTDTSPMLMVNRQYEFSRYEFKLLRLLAFSPERVFTNEQLYHDVWGEDYLRDSDNGLHSCLNRIRRKLEEAGCTSCRIENIRGVDYRFIQDDT